MRLFFAEILIIISVLFDGVITLSHFIGNPLFNELNPIALSLLNNGSFVFIGLIYVFFLLKLYSKQLSYRHYFFSFFFLLHGLGVISFLRVKELNFLFLGFTETITLTFFLSLILGGLIENTKLARILDQKIRLW